MFGLMPFEHRQNSLGYNPFRELEEMERSFFGSRELSAFKTDIQDKGNAYELSTDLPGFKKDDIHLELDGDTAIGKTKRRKAALSAANAALASTAAALMYPVWIRARLMLPTKMAC